MKPVTHAPGPHQRPLCGARGRKVMVAVEGTPHDCPTCIGRLAEFAREAEGFRLQHFEVRDQKRLDETETDYTAPEPVIALMQYVLRKYPHLARTPDLRFLDPSAGAGIFGQVVERLLPQAHRTGVELRGEEDRHLRTNYNLAAVCDFEIWAADQLAERRRYEQYCRETGESPHPRAFRFDLIATNPPFSRAFRREIDKKTRAILRRAWIETCHDLLTPGGVLVFVGLTQWGQALDASDLVKAYTPARQYRYGGRLSFEEHGQTDTREYSGWIWRNDYRAPIDERLASEDEPTWPCANGHPLAVRKWQAGSIPGTYPLPAEMFS